LFSDKTLEEVLAISPVPEDISTGKYFHGPQTDDR
jgi:hypothetical protein